MKKSSFTKCVKMSKEVENLKNGILNGDLLNHIQHQQQKQSKLGNSNADRETKAIVGGRLQFYKGKYRISQCPIALRWFSRLVSSILDHFQEENLHSFVCGAFFVLLCSSSLPLVSFPLFSLLPCTILRHNTPFHSPDVGFLSYDE